MTVTEDRMPETRSRSLARRRERVQGMRAVHRGLSAQGNSSQRRLNHYGYRTATYERHWMYRLRNLLLGMSRARSNHGSASASPRRHRAGGGPGMRKQLMKGNEAIVKSAILAGCRAFLWISDHAGKRDHRSRGALHAAVPAASSCRPKAKWPPSTCSMAHLRPVCAA